MLNNDASSEILFTDALIYDGTGSAPFIGCFSIKDKKINNIKPNGQIHLTGHTVRSLKGYAVAPGFIDVHSHSDISICACPSAYSKISQGVTTELVGNCGLSVFPVSHTIKEHLDQLYASYSEKITWNNLSEYVNEVQRRHPAINIGSLCGHNTLRASAAGYDKKKLSPEDIKKMQILLDESIKDGAFGFSTGLLYVPGIFSTEYELQQMMTVLKKNDSVYATHLRNEGNHLLESVTEAISLAKIGSGRLQISHIKTAGKKNWHKINDVFQLIENAQKDGLLITADRYPYIQSQTSQSIMLPPPYDTMSDNEIQSILSSDIISYQKLLTSLSETGIRPDAILTNTNNKHYSKFCGKTFLEISNETEKSQQEILAELMASDATGTTAAFSGLSENNLQEFIKKEYVCCGTDENSRPLDYSIGKSHPRAFGSFPRFISIGERAGIPLEKMIHKITLLPARIFGIKERGMLSPGYYADFIVFDPRKLKDTQDFLHPHSPAEGIISVFVNGREAYRENKVITRCGMFIRK